MEKRDGAYYLRLYRDGLATWEEILWMLDRDEPRRDRWNAAKALNRLSVLGAQAPAGPIFD